MKTELIAGQIYRIRLTDGTWTDGRFLHVKTTTWLRSRSVTHFMFRNERTGREIEIKSRQRIKEAMGLHTPSVPSGFNQARDYE